MSSTSPISQSFFGILPTLHELQRLEPGSLFSEEFDADDSTLSVDHDSPLWKLQHLEPGSLFSSPLEEEEEEIPQPPHITPHHRVPPGFESPSEQDSIVQRVVARTLGESPEGSPNTSDLELNPSPTSQPLYPFSPTFYRLSVRGISSPCLVSPQYPGWVFCPVESRPPQGSPLLTRPPILLQKPLPQTSFSQYTTRLIPPNIDTPWTPTSMYQQETAFQGQFQ